MTKVYPNAASLPPIPEPCDAGAKSTAVLTVWKKSLLLNCNGYTVFGGDGDLVYRVDNYISGNKGEIVLMDAQGSSLLTIRRKILSLGDTWMVFDGESDDNPRFTVRKNVKLLQSKNLAQVISSGVGGRRKNELLYEIEGSYSRRCCAVYDGKRRCVLEIKPKEASVRGVAFGTDVFHLVVNSGIDAAAAMAIVILLDQMFGSSNTRGFLTN